MAMVSPAAVEKYGDRFNEHLVGSGPFQFVSETPHVEVVLEKNPDYDWAPEVLHDGPAHLDRVVFKFILEDETRLATLRTGETHIIDEVPPAQVDPLQENADFDVVGAPKVGIARGIHFNTELPPTDDVQVRKAILHAIDREAINEAVFKGVYPLAYQVLTRGTRFYDKSLEDMYPHDPERAIELLEEAGWTEVNDEGYRVKDGQVLEIFHATFPGFVAEAPAEIVQAQLKDVGIKFDINVMTGTAMMDGISAQDSTFNSALIGTYSPEPGLILRRFYHSSGYGATLYSHYSNERLDELLDAGLATTDEEERAEIYSEIEQIVMEEALVAPIYANVSVFGMSNVVEGFGFDPYAHPELFDVQISQ